MLNPQNEEQWLKDKCGNVGASRIADIMARTKSGYSTSRANYMASLIVEKLTGANQNTFTNSAMQWGVDNESNARDMYQFLTDSEVSMCGFIMHPEISGSGASPDGLVNDDGLVEIKCPFTATHLETLIDDAIDGKYIKQMQWQMACTGRKWCDFVSFDPRLCTEMQIKIIRVLRDDNIIKDMESEVSLFIKEMEAKLEILKNKYLS